MELLFIPLGVVAVVALVLGLWTFMPRNASDVKVDPDKPHTFRMGAPETKGLCSVCNGEIEDERHDLS